MHRPHNWLEYQIRKCSLACNLILSYRNHHFKGRAARGNEAYPA